MRLLFVSIIVGLGLLFMLPLRASAACGFQTQEGIDGQLAAIRSSDAIPAQSKALQAAQQKLAYTHMPCSDDDQATTIRAEGSVRVLQAWTFTLWIRLARSMEVHAPSTCRAMLRQTDRFELVDTWTRYFGEHWNQYGSDDRAPAIAGAIAAQHDPKFAHVRSLMFAEAQALHVVLPSLDAPQSVLDGATKKYEKVAYSAVEHAPENISLFGCESETARNSGIIPEQQTFSPYFSTPQFVRGR